MPIGTGIVYNAGDLILSQVSGSGTAFLETKIAAATSSLIYFDNTARINSASLSSITVGTSSYVSGSTSIITNLTASNISASATGSFGIVGIGTTAPGALLHVYGATPTIRIQGNSVASAKVDLVGTYTTWSLENQYVNGANNDMFRIYNSALSADAITINRATNNVGIGTTNPGSRLEVQFPTNPATDNGAGNNVLRVWTSASFAADVGGAIGLGGTYNTSSYQSFGQIAGRKTNALSSSNAGYLQFATTNTAGTMAEWMRIDAGGNVGIGTTSPAYKLDVSGSSRHGYRAADTHQFTGSVSFTDGLSLTNLTASNVSASATGSFGIIGIGTVNPAYKLDVNGNANFTNGFYTNTDASSTSYFIGANGTRPIIFQNNTATSYDFGFKFSDSNTFTLVGGNTLANPTTDLVSFTYDGKVGIGSTVPAYSLDVNGNARVGDSLYVTTATTADAAIEIGRGRSGNGNSYVDLIGDATYTDYGLRLIRSNGGANATSAIAHRGTGTLYFTAVDAAAISLETSNTTRMTITSGGNVGIGTTLPITKFHVYAAANGNNWGMFAGNVGSTLPSGYTYGVLIGSNYSNGFSESNIVWGQGISSNQYFAIGKVSGSTSYSEQLRIDTNGNVGIGTTNPFATLQVAGNISGSSFTSSVSNAVGFLGTSSWAQNVVTASYLVPTNNYIVNSLTASNISASGYISASKFWGLTGTFTNVSSSGPVVVSGSNAYIQLLPVGAISIPANTSASYIYCSGSTNDLYFTQYQGPYTNTTRLRWLESNMYTGILYGGQITSTPGSTTFNVKSGSGLIVAMNATTGSDPYPTIRQIGWPDYTNVPITYSGSAKITYVGLDNTAQIVQQTNAWGSTDINQWDTQINLGVVLTLSGSVSTGVFNSPQISYGYPQKTDDFTRAFGPLKISGHTLQASGSGLSIQKTGGTSFREGANYYNNPNHPSTVVENAITASKIYRYYMSGSTAVIDTGVNNAGYTTLDITKYNNNGVLTSLAGSYNNQFTLQRVFWVPNSPTNAFLVYYGNAVYSTLLDATNAVNTEAFTEAPNTALNAIQLATIVIEGDSTNLTTANKCTIVQAGLFRNVGGVGSGGTTPVVTSLDSLSDVAIAGVTQGDLLTYGNGTQWVNSKTLVGAYTLSGSLVTNDGVSVNSLSASVVSASIVTAGTITTTNISSSGTIIYKNGVLLDYTSSITPSTVSVILQNLTGSYNAAFFDYAVFSSSNSRAGTIVSTWNGGSIVYNETCTTDIGNTNAITMSVALSSSFVRLVVSGSGVTNWNIKAAARYI
jgi:hypothetical protein